MFLRCGVRTMYIRPNYMVETGLKIQFLVCTAMILQEERRNMSHQFDVLAMAVLYSEASVFAFFTFTLTRLNLSNLRHD